MIHLIIFQSTSPFGNKNDKSEAVAEAARKKENIQQMNNNIVNTDNISSNISKPSPFGYENDRSEAVAEAAKKKENIQQLNNSCKQR